MMVRFSTLVVAAEAILAASAAAESPDAVDLCGHNEELCGLQSFSGFVDVPNAGSLWYWYFEPLNHDPEAPLVLWLQGGPGSSSMVGNFFEMGPVSLDESNELRRRAASDSWGTDFPIVFVDSPVGTGWSYAADESGYARNETDVAHALAFFLQSFKAVHPEVPDNLVIAGESYGGHYVPALARHLINHPGSFNLQAILVGDGLTDPKDQELAKPLQAFAFGLIDEKQLREAQKYAQQAHDLVVAGDVEGADAMRGRMEDVVIRASHINVFDVRSTDDYSWQDERMAYFFSRPSIKDLLHLPRDRNFGTSPRVGYWLRKDVMHSFKGHIEAILQAGVPVLLYQGQFDWKDGVMPSEAWIRTMNWDGIQGFLDAHRAIWRRMSDGRIAGYWRSYRNLHQVVVANAGHMVPMDQPLSAVDLLVRFLRPDGASVPGALSKGSLRGLETVLYN